MKNNDAEKFNTIINWSPPLALTRGILRCTLLHLAAQYGRKECAEILLLHGCCVNDTDDSKTTALHVAAKENYVDFVRCLLQHDSSAINLVDEFGKTALHYAAFNNHQEMVEFLLQQQSIDVNIKNNKGQMADDRNINRNIRTSIKGHRVKK